MQVFVDASVCYCRCLLLQVCVDASVCYCRCLLLQVFVIAGFVTASVCYCRRLHIRVVASYFARKRNYCDYLANLFRHIPGSKISFLNIRTIFHECWIYLLNISGMLMVLKRMRNFPISRHSWNIIATVTILSRM